MGKSSKKIPICYLVLIFIIVSNIIDALFFTNKELNIFEKSINITNKL